MQYSVELSKFSLSFLVKTNPLLKCIFHHVNAMFSDKLMNSLIMNILMNIPKYG